MPEEINRIVTDRLSDLLLTPDLTSSKNLINEGIPESIIVFVGNIMIDTLEHFRKQAIKQDIYKIIINNLYQPQQQSLKYSLNLNENNLGVVTLHRPINVDDPILLNELVSFFTVEVSRKFALIWPLHPRTEKQLRLLGLLDKLISNSKILILKPLGYIEMLRLNMLARFFITDSGGLQEECTVLGTPCLILRNNTERPATLRENGGTCVLAGNEIRHIQKEFRKILSQKRITHQPELWDGQTAERSIKALLKHAEIL